VTVYLEQTGYDLEAAIQAYKDDERWEKEHPFEGPLSMEGKERRDMTLTSCGSRGNNNLKLKDWVYKAFR
jgi:hypothetical protein